MSNYLSPRATSIAAYTIGLMAAGTACVNLWLSEVCNNLRTEIATLERKIEESEKERAANSAKLAALQKKQETSKPAPLAVINNNPLNVKAREKDPWQGQIGQDKFGHAVFASPQHGLRAASFVLNAYAKKHKIGTIHGLVERFAEANHNAYAAYLSKALGVAEDETIDLVRRMPELLPAMARFETGKAWPEEYFLAFHVWRNCEVLCPRRSRSVHLPWASYLTAPHGNANQGYQQNFAWLSEVMLGGVRRCTAGQRAAMQSKGFR